MKAEDLIRDEDKNLLINRLVDTYLQIFNITEINRNVVLSQLGISTLLTRYASEVDDIDENLRGKINRLLNASLSHDVVDSIMKDVLSNIACKISTYRFRDSEDTVSSSSCIDFPIHGKSEEFIALVNECVNKDTSGMIQSILSSPLPGDVSEFWLSTVAFESYWGMQCNKLLGYLPFNNSTYDKDYFTFQTNVKKYASRYGTCFKLPYKDDCSMLIYKSDIECMSVLDCISGIDIKVSLLAECFKEIYIIMNIPCFDISSDMELSDMLHLPVSMNMKQTTRVICNEKGTREAPVTSDCSLPKEIVTIDEPFIFVIQDNKSKLPLFMGYIEEVN